MRSGILIRLFGIVVLLLITSAAPSYADELPTTADKAAIVRIIEMQIDAFRRDDGAEAFSYASPGIQSRFGNVENFMAAVISGYQPHYRPRSVQFQDLITLQGQATQRVLFVGPDGVAVVALYSMAHMDDGSWRIDGCFLLEGENA